MAKVDFYSGEDGQVNIFNVPLEEHRRICHESELKPSVQQLGHRPGMFYRHASQDISGININLYSEDSSVEKANLWEEGQLREIKDRIARMQQERAKGEDND